MTRYKISFIFSKRFISSRLSTFVNHIVFFSCSDPEALNDFLHGSETHVSMKEDAYVSLVIGSYKKQVCKWCETETF